MKRTFLTKLFVLCLAIICCAVFAGASSVRTEGGIVLSVPEVQESKLDVTLFADTRSGDEITVNGVRYQIGDTEATIVGYTQDIAANCTIPASVSGVPVTGIGDSAFNNCSQIKTISLPDSLTSIEANAFFGCIKLQTMTIPKNVSSIGGYAFQDCSSLTAFTVASGNTAYYATNGALFAKSYQYGSNEAAVVGITYNNVLLQYPIGSTATSYTAPSGTQMIASSAFYRAANLQNVTLPDSVKVIGSNAFAECKQLKTIDLGKGVETIEVFAFDNCTSLSALNLPATTIEVSEFGTELWALAKITVAAGNPRYYADTYGVLFDSEYILGYDREYDEETGEDIWTPSIKTALLHYPAAATQTAYSVPAGTKCIGSNAFWEPKNLKTLTLPDGLEFISSCAFTGCTGLTSITIPDSVISIGGSAFQTCHNLASVNLGTGITTLPDGLFYSCGLTSIHIPAQVTTIMDTAFEACEKLASITVDAANQSFTAVDNILYNKEKTSLLLLPASFSAATLTLPKTITAVAQGIFNNCTTLEKIEVEAGSTAFYAVDGVLFEINDENTATLHSYPRNKQQAAYKIPDGVTAVAPYAAANNEYLKVLDINQVQVIGSCAFWFCRNLVSIDLRSVVEVGQNALFVCDNLTSVTFPSTLQNVAMQALDYNDKLDHIVFLGETPPMMDSWLCYNAPAVRYVYVPQGTQSTYNQVLAGCVTPGAMIVEGSYVSVSQVAEQITQLEDTATKEEVNEAAANVVRLTKEEATRLSDADLLKAEQLFQNIHSQTLTQTVDTAGVTTTEVSIAGLTLASGLVEKQAADGTVSGQVSLTVTEVPTESAEEILSLDFTLLVNEEEAQPQSPVLITVKLPQGEDPGKLVLEHKNDAGETELIPFTTKGLDATFRGQSFSTYTFRKATTEDLTAFVICELFDTALAADCYLAAYNSDGKMVSLTLLNTVTGYCRLPFASKAGLTYRAFLLDEYGVPSGTVSFGNLT